MEDDEKLAMAFKRLRNLTDALSDGPDFEELEEDWRAYSVEQKAGKEHGRSVAEDQNKARPGEQKPKDDARPKTQ